MEIFYQTITVLISAFFIFASSIKIFGWQKFIFETQLKFFKSYGLNREIMLLVGIIELFGATSIWFQSSIIGLIGAIALAATSVGAIYFHLRFDTFKDAIPACVTLILSSLLCYKMIDVGVIF